jgi:uncharacterized membrane protein
MAQRGRQSFEKRQREMDRNERAQQKEARRQERRESDDDGEAVDEAALMGQYGRLAERHAAGEITDERFAERKREIF